VEIYYTTRCNPNPALLSRLNRLGSGFAIVSAGELTLLETLKTPPSRIIYTNPVTAPAAIAAAYASGVDRFAVDSPQQARTIAEHAPGSRVFVRMRTASAPAGDGRFGAAPGECVDLMLYATKLGLLPWGISWHVGSQHSDPTSWAAAIARSAHVMEQLSRRGIRLQMLDMGGGYPVPMGDDPVPAVTEIATYITSALEDLPYRIRTAIEPGRYIAAPAGVMVATVLADVVRDGVRWVHLDVPAAVLEAGHTGRLVRYPLSDSRAAASPTPAHVAGPTGDAADTLDHDARLSADLRPGDRVCIDMAGAYPLLTGSLCGLPPPVTYVLDPAA
jgi:ornithine decarboxylase